MAVKLLLQVSSKKCGICIRLEFATNRFIKGSMMFLQKATLLDLQKAQNEHDVEYHPDIIALGTIGRLKHMALHNAKYAARFYAASAESDQTLFTNTLTDSFIIGLSTANTLTQNLGKKIEGEHNIASEGSNSGEFTFKYLQIVGRMAKACESIDHLEDYPFRPEISKANVSLVTLLLNEALARNFDLVKAYADRIADVEKHSGFAIFASDR
ncbi:MAG: hypothetical protein ACR2O7_17220 [Parasphingorhabdus sp.]